MKLPLIILSIALAGGLLADSYNVGSTSAPWLNVESSPRAAALGGQGVALSGDALAALQDSPAGLAGMKGQQLSVAQNNWVQDTSLQQAAYGYSLGQAGGVAVGFTYMNYGSLDRYTVINGGLQAAGSFNPYGYAIKLGYGYDLGHGLSAGLEGKYLGESVDSMEDKAFTGDAGLQWSYEALNLGLSGSNLFGSLHDASLPSQVKAGAAYDLGLEKGGLKLLAGANVPVADSSAMSAGGGLEYSLAETFWGRVGYRWQSHGADGMSGLSAGFSFKYSLISLDYAFVAMGDLGNGNQVGLKAEF